MVSAVLHIKPACHTYGLFHLAGLGLGVGEQGRFSTYLQALLEVCLAIAEVTPLHPTPLGGSSSALHPVGSGEESRGGPPEATTSLTLMPSSPGATAKRKKLKVKYSLLFLCVRGRKTRKKKLSL